MKTFNYTIKDELGIHARPAGLLVKAAKEFTSAITIGKEQKSADAKKLFAIMSLGVKQGNGIIITADGADEDVAIKAMEEFFNNNL